MELGLTGKRVLVTGAHRGTGSVIARVLAREGAIVVVHGSADGDSGALAAELRSAFGVAHAATGDLTTDAGAARAVAEVEQAVGGIDVLVNSFGRASGGTWYSATPEDWIAAYQINTLSAVRMIQAFVPGMRERRFGRVIQLATVGTTRPNARMPQYYAAKAALANLTVSLAKELVGTGVTVNTVSPGLIHTAETEAYLRGLGEKHGSGGAWEDIERDGVKRLTGAPVGRMARPEEVADLVCFVASERAGYLHGCNFRIDGGATDTVQS